MTVRYAVASGVHWRRFDDEVAVYLAGRFETHLLDDAGGQVLEAVQACARAGEPASLGRLFGHLTADSETAPGEAGLSGDAATVLLPRLAALVQVGVLDACAC